MRCRNKSIFGQFGQRSASKEEVRHLQEEHEDRAGDSYENEYTASQNIIQGAIFFPVQFLRETEMGTGVYGPTGFVPFFKKKTNKMLCILINSFP